MRFIEALGSGRKRTEALRFHLVTYPDLNHPQPSPPRLVDRPLNQAVFAGKVGAGFTVPHPSCAFRRSWGTVVRLSEALLVGQHFCTVVATVLKTPQIHRHPTEPSPRPPGRLGLVVRIERRAVGYSTAAHPRIPAFPTFPPPGTMLSLPATPPNLQVSRTARTVQRHR